jgi:hypothetical protein
MDSHAIVIYANSHDEEKEKGDTLALRTRAILILIVLLSGILLVSNMGGVGYLFYRSINLLVVDKYAANENARLFQRHNFQAREQTSTMRMGKRKACERWVDWWIISWPYILFSPLAWIRGMDT